MDLTVFLRATEVERRFLKINLEKSVQVGTSSRVAEISDLGNLTQTAKNRLSQDTFLRATQNEYSEKSKNILEIFKISEICKKGLVPENRLKPPDPEKTFLKFLDFLDFLKFWDFLENVIFCN